MKYKDYFLAPLISATSDVLVGMGIEAPVVVFERPANIEHGHASTNVAMRYAKELSQSPLKLSELITEQLQAKQLPIISSVTAAAPGFINIALTAEYLSSTTSQIVSHFESGQKEVTLKGQKWVIEHTSPNPNKAMHLGHLRNNLTGMALSNILEFQGAEVIRDAVDNNRGIAIAKLMYGFLAGQKKNHETPTDIEYWVAHKDEWYTSDEKGVLPDLFVTECYLRGEQESKDEIAHAAIRKMVIDWEGNDAPTRELWSHVLSFSYAGMQRTLARLNSRWDVVWHEHEHYAEGKKYVEEGLKKGVFKKLEDGAVLSDLSAFDLPDTILLKNDGTALYITQDIALTALKKKEYGADRLIWVIGPEQSLQMKQLFAICEQLGIGERNDYLHVTYGYVGLTDSDGSFKKMSSRTGDVVLIDDVIDVAKEKIRTGFAGKEIRDEDVEMRAEALALAAVKFAILRSHKDQQLAFDVERSVDVHGDSGVYILYTYARIQSLLRKAKILGVEPASDAFEPAMELMAELFEYPSAIEKSVADFSAHHIAQQVLSVCAAFNRLYGQVMILEGDDIPAKLAVTRATGSVIKQGCELLGIQVLEEI